MSYLNSLAWFQDYEKFDEKTKVVLMLLSEREYNHRYLSTLYSKSGMPSFTLDSIIKNLETRGIVYIKRHASNDRIIVGLRERQDTLPTAMLLYTINGVIKDSFVIEYTKKSTDKMFYQYIKKNLLPKITDDEIYDIMKKGFHKWTDNEEEHVINITNTKIVPV